MAKKRDDQEKVTRERAQEALNAVIRENWQHPVGLTEVWPEEEGTTFSLPHGFHVMSASTGKGKTLTLLTMFILARLLHGERACYYAAGEPRAKRFALNPLSIVNESCSIVFVDSVNALFNFWTPPDTLFKGGDLELAISFEGINDLPAFKGGFQVRHAAVTYALNELAVNNKVVLIGVVNETLLPIPSVEGAAEGKIVITGLGADEDAPTLEVRNRHNRITFSVDVPTWAFQMVKKSLYGERS